MRKISPFVLEKIKQWEGFRPRAYDDATGNEVLDSNDQVLGTLTIGYGHTGPDVKPGEKITQEQGVQILLTDLQRFEDGVDKAVKVDLTDNQFGALVSFAFNIGVSAFRSSTLLKKLNKGDYASVPSELARWNKSTVNGKKVVVPGLSNRRAAEAGLWATGEFVSSGNVPVKPDTSPTISKETISWGAGIVGSLGSLFVGEGPVQYALAAVIVVGIGVGLWTFIQNRRAK